MIKIRLKNLGLSTSIAVLMVFSCGSASARWPCYMGGYCSSYSQESVPYFALHPPVYYSYPVARTYGIFPFPYYADGSDFYRGEPVFCRSITVEPRVVANRFVPQTLTAEASSASRQPLRIINSFVEQAEAAKVAQEAVYVESIGVKPKIVYPIRLTSVK